MNKFLNLFAPRTPIIIAEIGAKYAEMSVIKDMIVAAQSAGADLVKFQTYEAETISTPGSTFTLETGEIISQFDFFKSYELTKSDHRDLNKFCEQIGIPWISTPSHINDLSLLEEFDPIAYKTGSDDLTNLPFLKSIAKKGRPMIVSTGMCTLGEIEKAVEVIQEAGNDQLILLHCVVSYPSQIEDANLRVIETLRSAFGVPVGLSDHTTNELTSIVATCLDVVIIEKHFTLDHALKLPDHQASLDPIEFKALVEGVRGAKNAMGSGKKSILPGEEKWRKAARKSIFAAKNISVGQIITEDDLIIRRPSYGIHPHHYDSIVGRTAIVEIPGNTLLTWEMI